jgi:hypothetical protein
MGRRTLRKISIRARSVVQPGLPDAFLILASAREHERQGLGMISSLSNAHPTPVSFWRTLWFDELQQSSFWPPWA